MSESGRWVRALQIVSAAAGLVGSGCGGGDSDSSDSTGGIGIGVGSDATVSGGSTSTGTSNTTGTSSTTGTSNGSNTTGGTASSTTGAGGAGGVTTTGGAGGASTSGASTTGSAGFDCLEDGGAVPGTPAPCDFVDDSYDCCTRCVAQTCCDEFGACFASEPFNVCGGAEDSAGEFAAIQECMIYLPDGAVPSDLETCVADAIQRVSAPACGLGAISGPTNDLAVCVRGDEDGLGGCFEECFTPFDESACLY